MTTTRFMNTGVLILALAGAVGFSGTTARAQGFDGYGAPQGAVESFVDGYGRTVYLDRAGQIIGVAQPDSPGFQAPAARGGGQVFDRPPPPGVTLEGRADFDRGPEWNDGGQASGRPSSIDPFAQPDPFGQPEPYDDPYAQEPDFGIPDGGGQIEAAPLPMPGEESSTQTVELPREQEPGYGLEPEYDGLNLPEPGQSITEVPGAYPEGQTIRETDPAPQVAAPSGGGNRSEVAALQVLLDRAGMSPGVIDGRMGSNVNKAVAAYQEKYGRQLPTGDSRALAEELDQTGGPAVISYELTAEDVGGPFVASIPSDYGEKAKLPAMSFERPSEKLAEKFHMDEAYLQEINPGADFSRPGTRIKVMNVGANVTGEVARIEADKGREQVRAYDANGTLIAAYPSTIGSSSTPSPSGLVQVNRIAFDPNYTYNPKINFKQGENNEVLTIPPGPNGPVGSIWIALSKPTYGIHGTPEPSQIGKTNSYGCIRLTNWDAYELAKMVKAGVSVEFIE